MRLGDQASGAYVLGEASAAITADAPPLSCAASGADFGCWVRFRCSRCSRSSPSVTIPAEQASAWFSGDRVSFATDGFPARGAAGSGAGARALVRAAMSSPPSLAAVGRLLEGTTSAAGRRSPAQVPRFAIPSATSAKRDALAAGDPGRFRAGPNARAALGIRGFHPQRLFSRLFLSSLLCQGSVAICVVRAARNTLWK